MRVNEAAEALPAPGVAWRLEAALRETVAALEKGAALTQRQRADALEVGRRALAAAA